MARARVINPRLLDSPLLGKLGPAGGFFFVGMILLSDDAGRVRGDIIYLKRSIMGGCSTRIRNDRVQHWINILHQSGTTYHYTDEAGGQFIQITNWNKYQKLSHPTPSKIPAPAPDQIPEIGRNDSGAFPSREKRREGKGGGPLVAAQPSSPTPQIQPHTSPAPDPLAGSPSAPAAAPPASAPQKRNPDVGPPGSTLSENRLRVLLNACVPDKDLPRDSMRPWVTATCGTWFDRQTEIDRRIWCEEYQRHFGFDFNRGPQTGPPSGPPNAPARRSSWSPEPVSAPAVGNVAGLSGPQNANGGSR